MKVKLSIIILGLFTLTSCEDKINEAYLNFIQKFVREPSHEELAEILDIKPKDVANMMKGNGRHLSFDAPLGTEEGDSTMLDVVSANDPDSSPDINLMDQSLKEEVQQGLSILSPREVEVLSSYYGLNGYKSCKPTRMVGMPITRHYRLTL